MKLKNILFISFLILTLIPVGIVSILLYNSGYQLSKESYLRNLSESINVQADYITQTLENDMVSDFRFANRVLRMVDSAEEQNVLQQFHNYLESSEDKVNVCALLDRSGEVMYKTGEKGAWESISAQLPELSGHEQQTLEEFNLGNQSYSLGIITSVRDTDGEYAGSMVTVYDMAYIFKIISSYYEITDTSTYICRTNGEIIDSRKAADDTYDTAAKKALKDIEFDEAGIMDIDTEQYRVLGCYKKLYNSPWVLIGVIDEGQIFLFLNQFIRVYIFIIVVILLADIILAAYFSHRVVVPINSLIAIMDGYPKSLENPELAGQKKEYFETMYLREKFFKLMLTIQRVQHNFEGVYKLYQSNTMNDTNIEIDTIAQKISCNKENFELLIKSLPLSQEACIVERFTRCFVEKDQEILTRIFEDMRDKQLSGGREAEVFTPHLDQRWYHILVVPTYADERLSKLFIQLRDVTNFRKKELASSELAVRDQLTGLYNRGGFFQKVENLLSEKSDCPHGLLFIDINDFKLVNDNFGHSAGDKLLKNIAEAINQTVGDVSIVSRFGGDEFAIFIPNNTKESVENIKCELMQKLVFTYEQKADAQLQITASIGITIYDKNHTATLEEILHDADTAMYEEKRRMKRI